VKGVHIAIRQQQALIRAAMRDHLPRLSEIYNAAAAPIESIVS
jgi:hypothetical protein